jgi:hypothetical protein
MVVVMIVEDSTHEEEVVFVGDMVVVAVVDQENVVEMDTHHVQTPVGLMNQVDLHHLHHVVGMDMTIVDMTVMDMAVVVMNVADMVAVDMVEVAVADMVEEGVAMPVVLV